MRYYLGIIGSPQKWWRVIRTWWLRIRGMQLGRRTVIRFPLGYRHPKHIRVGADTAIGEYAFLVAGPGSWISIGSNTLLAPNVHVNTTQHRYDRVDVEIMYQGYTEGDIVIGDDCWLGTGVIVLKGVTIGDGAVVGAGSLVKDDVEPYSVVAGSPAKFVKRRGQRVIRNT